jgi:hypothetical protein
MKNTRSKPSKSDEHDRLTEIGRELEKEMRDFFSTSLPDRIRKLPDLIKHADQQEAKKLRPKCEKMADLLEHNFNYVIKWNALDLVVAEWIEIILDAHIRSALRAAFRLLLHQLMVEVLLQKKADQLDVQGVLRRAWGVDSYTDADLAKEIARIFDGGIRRRFDCRSPGKPKGAAGADAAKRKRKPTPSLNDIANKVARRLQNGAKPYQVSQKAIAGELQVSAKTIERRVKADGHTWKSFVQEIAQTR